MSLTVTDLRCEGLPTARALGIDVPAPALAWRLEGGGRGSGQAAYQVQTAPSAAELAGDKAVWDTGRVTADTVTIPYGGPSLAAFQQIVWRVRVWDENGRESPWSAPASWTMGPLAPSDWAGARWISAGELLDFTPPEGKSNALQEKWETLLLLRNFRVRAGLVRALLIVSGLGQHFVTVNGARVSDLLTPGWTDYARHVLYDTYEVTEHIQAGENAVGLLLGNGFYNVHGGRYAKFVGAFRPQKAICLLRLQYGDGSAETIASDESWQVAPGPITFSCMYGGEDWDARRVPDGWDRPGFAGDARWESAAVTEGPGGELRGAAHASPPFRSYETLTPRAIHPAPGEECVSIYDLGQNASLMPRLRVRGPAGSVVRITPAEALTPEGTLDRRSVGGRQAYWQYTLKGAGDSGGEHWFPAFFYHGCRYLQVECLPAPGGDALPTVEELEGVIVHADCAPIGEFSCSHDLLNRIHTLIHWAQRSNLAHVITDCPHRERLGWLEQYHLHGPSLRANFDIARLYRKCFDDMAASQTPDGLVPDIAPEYVVFSEGFRDSPEWGSAFILCAWQQYEWTGETAHFARHYDAMKRYVAYLVGTAKDGIVTHGLGDWYDIGPDPPGYAQLTPKALTATAHCYLDVAALSRIAALLGKENEAAAFARQAEATRDAFNHEFLKPDSPNGYATGSQCANAVPLACGLVPDQERERIVAALVQSVADAGMAITTGDIGHRYLLRALADAGRSDVIFALHGIDSGKPGYAFQLKRGCTSLAESWDADPRWSQNHFMLGHLTEWLYADLAGLAPDPEYSGWAGVLVRPQPVQGVEWARARYDSPHGPVTVEWRKEGHLRFALDLSLPPGVYARVTLPTDAPESVTESVCPIPERTALLSSERDKSGHIACRVRGGTWRFACRLASQRG